MEKIEELLLHSASAAAGDGKIMDVDGYTAVVCQVSGTFVATITWKISIDKTNFITVMGYNLNNAEESSTATAAGIYIIPLSGCTQFMADITAFTSGTVTVTARAFDFSFRSNTSFTYNTVTSGERQGSATAVQLPDVAGKFVYISALADNAGNVYLGASTVTVPDGTTDTTSGLVLEAGDTIGPLPLSNLNKLYMICDNAGDDITYLVLG